MMPRTPIKICIFGREGCSKTRVLSRRINRLLASRIPAGVDLVFYDIETVDGLTALAEAGCIDPERVPALLIAESCAESDEFIPIKRPAPSQCHPLLKRSMLYGCLGLATDYTDAGKGVISSAMIEAFLHEVLPEPVAG